MRHGTWRPVCATLRARYQLELEPADFFQSRRLVAFIYINIDGIGASTKT